MQLGLHELFLKITRVFFYLTPHTVTYSRSDSVTYINIQELDVSE